MKIFLIGFMGAGKTYLGRQLAEKLDIPFIDTDEWIENHHQKSIAEIFSNEGEEAFRILEKVALHTLCEIPSAVISCGGGMPCYFDNMEVMLKNGSVLYLQMDPEVLRIRLSRNGLQKRPLLSGKTSAELQEWIVNTLQQREPYYLKAQYIIQGDSLRAEDLINLLGSGVH